MQYAFVYVHIREWKKGRERDVVSIESPTSRESMSFVSLSSTQMLSHDKDGEESIWYHVFSRFLTTSHNNARKSPFFLS